MRKLARFALLAAGLGVVPVLAQDDAEEEDGGGFLERQIESRLSSEGFEVNVRGFEGALSSRATIAQITIADEEGVWLTVNDAVLDWTRTALLRGRLQVEELSAAEILLPRLPEGGEQPADVPSPEAQPFSLPELPVSINIEQLAIERAELGQPVIGEAAVLSLSGGAQLADGSGEVTLQANRIDDEQGQFNIAGSFDNESRELSVDLGVDEGPDGIVANLIDLPGRPSLELSVEGEGPLSDFTAEIGLLTEGEPRLAGTVSLLEVEGANRFAVDLGGDVTALFNPEYRPFFGPDVSLEAEGATRPGGGFDLSRLDLAAQSLSLTGQVAVGADGVPDLIDLRGQIAAADGPVLLPVGEAIRLGRADLDIRFDASAGEDWTALVAVEDLDTPTAAIDRVALDGGGIIAGSGETLDVEAGFDFTAAGLSLADAGLAEALGDSIEGRLEIGYEAGDPILLDVLRLAGAGFRLDGEGQVDPDGENVPLELTAALEAQDFSVFSGLAGRPLSGAGTLDLDLAAEALSGAFDVDLSGQTRDLGVGIAELDPLIDGQTDLSLVAQRDETGLRVETLRVENPDLDLSAQADLTSEGGTATADLRIEDLAQVDPELSGPATLSFRAERPQDVWDMVLTAAGAEAEIDGTATLSQLEAESPLAAFDLSVAAADLSNFATLAGRDLGGAVDMATQGTARLDLQTVDATLAGTMTDVALGQTELDNLLAGETQIDAALQRLGDAITVPRLLVRNPQITVTGEADVDPGNSTVAARIALAELGQVVERMSGPATLVLDATEGSEGWRVDLDGDGAGARIAAEALVQGLREEGTVPLVDGTAALNVADLSVFSDLAGRDLGGAVDLSVEGRARTDLSEAQAAVDGEARDLALGQAELDRLFAGVTDLAFRGAREGEAVRVEDLSLTNPQIAVTGQGSYGPGDSAAQARVVLPDLGAVVPEMAGRGEIVLDAQEEAEGGAWQVTLDGDGAGAALEAAARISDLAGTPLVDGEASLSAEDLSRFSRLAGRTLAGSVTLEAAGEGRVDGSRFDATADARATGLRTGIAQVDDLLAGGSTELAVSAARDGAEAPIRVRTFRLDAPGLDATAEGQVLGGSSDLGIDVRLANLATFVEGLDGPVTAQGRVGQAGQDIRLDLDLTGPQGTNAAVQGTLAESFDRADLRATGSLPLTLANPFLDPQALSGTARFDLGLSGPLAPTALNGTVTLENGRFVAPTVPAVLTGINGTAEIGGGEVRLSISADKQEGGQIRVSGPISLQPGYSADLGIVLAGVVFEDPRLYRTILNGEVGVTGPLAGGAAIGGTIRLGETELRVPSTGLGATGPIPDGLIHANESPAVRETLRRAGLIEEPGAGEEGSGPGVAYPLDLTIQAENRIFIRGRGLDAELGGELQLDGTTANVIPSGRFELIRGRLDLLGQRIDLAEGAVTLQGDFDPVIRLVAEADTGEVTVFIVVEGQATEPEISFRSTPDLPEDEVLARLLFGRSIEDISPLQAAQLASAVATLAGRGGGGVVNNLRESTGLDDLDVTTDDEGNVGLQAGKYISENVYTDVTVDSAGEAEINLNLDVTESITVRGGTSNEGDTSVGVFFERDY